jgi:hypothetical protein
MQTTRSGAIPPYIGADLTDRHAKGARPIDVCGLHPVGPGRFEADYWQWTWDRAPAALNVAAVADEITGALCTLIDGPQALAAEGADVRECERLARTSARTPDTEPADDRFASGFIRSSLEFFRALHTAGVAVSPPGFLRGAGEVYPGVLWQVLARRVLPRKGSTGGQVARRAILQALGVQNLPSLTSHDQADACLAALIAAAADGKVPGLTIGALGRPLDVGPAELLREGPIAMPAKIESRLQEKIDRALAQPAAQGKLDPEMMARATVTIDLAKVKVEAPSLKPKAPPAAKRSAEPKTPAKPKPQPKVIQIAVKPTDQPKIVRRPTAETLRAAREEKAAAKPKAAPKPAPKPKAKPKPKPAPAPKPTPKAEAKPKPAAKPKAKPKPTPPEKPARKAAEKPAKKKAKKAAKKKKAAAKKQVRKAAPKKRTPAVKKKPKTKQPKKTKARKKAAPKKRRVAPGTPPSRSGNRAARAQALVDWMVKEAKAGRPVLATYAWVHRFCLGRYPHWSGARTKAVRELAGATRARAAGALGKVRLDCFVVARATRRTSGGYKRGPWRKLLGKARLLA